MAFPGKLHITAHAGIFILLAAVSAFFGQYLMNLGYRYLSAIKGSILSFVKIPMTIALSLLIGESFGWKMAMGTLLIMGGFLVSSIPYAVKKIRS